ncbi:Protein roadkill [Clonorchis sinensis]|uniref:Protein roadkill n=1 Tax=Clonorchis sinensis TaxID=79923 RepID=A0A8T1MTR8_CLOSI|nr:Protein roadkill [Clonorchis sinensis]
MEALRTTLDSTDGQVATVSRTSSPPPLDVLTPPVVAEYWCHTQVRVTKMKYIWTISNFSFCREEMGEVVKSSFFSCGPNDKLKWCLRINPKGLDEESREYLSLYLLLVNCGTKSEARAKFKFSILNAKREETKAMESQRAYRFVQGKDWGFKKFIRRDVLMDEANGLLPNDRLTILCEVSVVGETLSESGQVNNQPISVPECNLHEDIGSLLFKQLLTDVTLVVVSNTDSACSSKCQTPNALTHGSGSSYALARSDQVKKYPQFESAGEEDEEEEEEEEQDEVEEADEFDEEDEDDEEQEGNDSEREEDSQPVPYRQNRISCVPDDASQPSYQNVVPADRGEAEAAASRGSGASETPGSSANSAPAVHPIQVACLKPSSLTLAPATTTIVVPTKGVIIPLNPTSQAPVGFSPAAQTLLEPHLDPLSVSSASNVSAAPVVSTPINGDWRFTTPSSSNSATPGQSVLSTDEREMKSDTSCDTCGKAGSSNAKDGQRCRGCCRSANATPSTSSTVPTTSASSKSTLVPATVANPTDLVGSSSGANGSSSCTQSLHPHPSVHSKEKPDPVEGLVEAETSTRIRRSNRRRTTATNNTSSTNTTATTSATTPTSNRSSRTRSSREPNPTTTTVTKAASSTTTSAPHAAPTPSSSTAIAAQPSKFSTSTTGQFSSNAVSTNSLCGCNASNATSSTNNATANTSNTVVLRQFEAHKAILAARSPVFAAMFEHGMEESRANRVEITDMEPDTLAEVLRYIYTGQVVGMDKLAHDLLAAADKYQLERLKTMCEEALVESLSVENCCDILGLADMHNADQLKAHTLEFIMLHAHDVCETEGYDQLVRHRPRLLNECFRSLASQQLPLRCWARKRPRQS